MRIEIKVRVQIIMWFRGERLFCTQRACESQNEDQKFKIPIIPKRKWVIIYSLL